MLLIGSLLLGLVVTSSATTWMPLDCDVSGGEMNCEVNLGRNFELGRKARVELKYPRASGAIQQLSFFNEDGGLEYYVRFWDKDTQKIRIGSDLEECHYTRDIPVESRVTGDMIRVVIEANKLASWLSINGKDPVIGPGNMHLRPFARDLCEKRPRDFAKMTFSRNVRNPDPIQFRVKSLRRGWPCERAKSKLDMCREKGYAIGDCKVGNGELSNKKRRKCEMMESKYGEKCGDYETMWCEIVKPENPCPASHPYVYLSGAYCCASDEEKDDDFLLGARCDGSKIGYDSGCCKGDSYKACPYESCVNYA